MSIGQNVKPFTGKGEQCSIGLYNPKQTNKQNEYNVWWKCVHYTFSTMIKRNQASDFKGDKSGNVLA